DVQGGLQIRQKRPDALLVFLLPPSFDELIERLHKRGTEDESRIRRRMRTALGELDQALSYDVMLVNDDLDETVERLKRLIRGKPAETGKYMELCERLKSDISRYLDENL
ncbi:MAG: guanylate kinase, partial [Deltaproteobacteria bacterium]